MLTCSPQAPSPALRSLLLCSAPSLFLHPSVNPFRSPTSALLPPLPPFIILDLTLFFSVILFSMPAPSPLLTSPPSPAFSSPRLLHNRCVCNASQVGRHDEAALETEREREGEIAKRRGARTHIQTHVRAPRRSDASPRQTHTHAFPYRPLHRRSIPPKTAILPTAIQPPERTQRAARARVCILLVSPE